MTTKEKLAELKRKFEKEMTARICVALGKTPEEIQKVWADGFSTLEELSKAESEWLKGTVGKQIVALPVGYQKVGEKWVAVSEPPSTEKSTPDS